MASILLIIIGIIVLAAWFGFRPHIDITKDKRIVLWYNDQDGNRVYKYLN